MIEFVRNTFGISELQMLALILFTMFGIFTFIGISIYKYEKVVDEKIAEQQNLAKSAKNRKRKK